MIRVGFVGTGNISRRHFNALAQMREQAEIVAVCDVIEARAQAAAEPWGAKVHLSFPEMIAREKLDALYICLPPDAHVDQELTAIERGIHFFAEKPLPLDLAKARLIARRAEASGLVTTVGYQWRHLSHVERLRQALASERIGMALGYFVSALPDAAWWRLKARSGGQIVEQAIHMFDTSRYLLGEVEQVWADYALRVNQDEPGFEQEDVYTVNLRFQSGVIAAYAVSCILHRRYRVGLEIHCQRRAYRLSERELEVDDAEGIRSIALENDAGFAENAAFIGAIQNGDRSGIRSDYTDALKTQEVVLAANRSAEIGQPVHLDRG